MDYDFLCCSVHRPMDDVNLDVRDQGSRALHSRLWSLHVLGVVTSCNRHLQLGATGLGRDRQSPQGVGVFGESMEVSGLTHWSRDEMNSISQTTFSNVFSSMKMCEFRLKISLKFVPKGAINKIPALFQIMAWRRPGDKPLSGTMLVSLLTHKCVTRPQWVKAPCRLRHKIEDGFIVCKHSK